MHARAARDARALEEELSRPTLDAARAALERKARVYEKLRRGKSGGLSEKQYEALLVDVRGLAFLFFLLSFGFGFWFWFLS